MLAEALVVGLDDKVKGMLVDIVRSLHESGGASCLIRNFEFWNRFDDSTYARQLQDGHALGTYLFQLSYVVANHYELYAGTGCALRGTACKLSPELQVDLMVKLAALKLSGCLAEMEDVARALHQ